MKYVNCVVRFNDFVIVSVKLPNDKLSEFITNIKIYNKDINFVKEFVDTNSLEYTSIFPLESGIIVIDFVNDVILDSQCITGVNKITPADIKMSQRGNKFGETKVNATITRFKELVESGRLKGLEEWYDSGTALNTDVVSMDFETVLDLTMHTNIYGQFVFSTKPFKVIHFLEHDKVEQHKLYNYLVENNFIKSNEWFDYLQKLK